MRDGVRCGQVSHLCCEWLHLNLFIIQQNKILFFLFKIFYFLLSPNVLNAHRYQTTGEKKNGRTDGNSRSINSPTCSDISRALIFGLIIKTTQEITNSYNNQTTFRV